MLHAATIFLSSFLLFLVQPLIARLVLPWFGGSAAVWTTCMLFFQALLLAGYAYAHFIVKRRFASLVHTALLAGAIALLPIAPAASWKPAGGEEPIHYILLVLGSAVGLQYFLLAATSPLLQAWYVRARPQGNPYRLFAISNLASLLALVGYPFLIEPVFSAHEQVALWSWLFGAFALVCAGVAWTTPPPVPETPARVTPSDNAPRALWVALAATASVLLLAVTNHLTQNVAAVPLLWLAPLTIYLLSFIVTFEGRNWYSPRWYWPILIAALAAMVGLLLDTEHHYRLWLQLGVYLPGLFVACVFCHGELYRLRPGPQRLTAFYLWISAGGALGGVFVAVVAPLAFNGYYELGIGLIALAALGALRYSGAGMLARYATLAAVLGVTAGAGFDAFRYQEDVLTSSRSFYGLLRVKEYGTPGEPTHLRRLVHGTIMHGEQFMHPDLRGRPTSYYEEPSGIGAALLSKRARPERVGVIGLGTGTIAAYGRKGDVFRFYDIDPRVIQIARSQFAFLGDSAAEVQLVVGDARLSLEREAPQGFDVLAVDAFSGDAIPVHLITREALAVYLRHMKPDGIVAFHVSNRFLDLIPVVKRIAAENGAQALLIDDEPDESDERSRSDWVLVSRSKAALAAPGIADHHPQEIDDAASWRTWTDDYSNLIQILK
jgi:SAM-dependent methyltransferase/Na+-translocating ferredoxin:NAD+ oxidoreductase RnfE subunit